MTSLRGRCWPTVTGHLSTLALVVCLASSGLLAVPPVSAAEPTTTVAIGESNSDAERAELLDLFGVVDSDGVVGITVEETFQAWEGIFDLSGVTSAYSSTALTCNLARPGIDVTTSNIEVIPPELYALALVTAGMADAELVVAAPDDAPALGMTALTGVFKTWDRSPCASMDSDPTRRQFALEQLALVAEIGQAHGGAEAVSAATDLVLSLQQTVVGGQVNSNDLDTMVASRAEQLGFPLAEGEATNLVGFFDDLSGAQLDWGGFANDWTVEHIGNGARVMMRPGEIAVPSSAPQAVATGVGGAVGTIPSASSPPTEAVQATAPPSPTTTPRALVIPSATATDTAPVAGVTGPTDPGGPSAGGSSGSAFPWWVLLGLIPLGLAALVLLRRRRSKPLVVRRVPPAAVAVAVAQRRSAGPTVPPTGTNATTTERPSTRRRFTVSGRTERPATIARVSRRVIDSGTSGD